MRGFAVHHSGILPILKEVVELLFQKGYVKVCRESWTVGMLQRRNTNLPDSLRD